MNKEQYLKIIERELHSINKKIDVKILQGVDYKKEAREHKELLKKIRQHRGRSFFNGLFHGFPQLSHF